MKRNLLLLIALFACFVPAMAQDEETESNVFEDSVKIGPFLYTLNKDYTADLIAFAEVLPAEVFVPASVQYKEYVYICPVINNDALDNAFSPYGGCETDSVLGKVETITFEEGIDSIAWTLMYFPHCKTVNFPKSVTKLHPKVFFSGVSYQGYYDTDRYDTYADGNTNYYFHDFEAFNVDPENPAYTSVDGVMYTKDMKTLVRYPQHKTTGKAVIPEGVEVLGSGSLINCEFTDIELPSTLKKMEYYNGNSFGPLYACVFLKDLVIPEGITRLETNTLRYLSSLETLTLPNSLTHISSNALGPLTQLKSINWQGCELDSLGYGEYYDGSAIYGCDSLEISFPKVVKHISSHAIYGGKMPTDLHLPKGVETVGSDILGLSSYKADRDLIKNIYLHDSSWLVADTLLFGTVTTRYGRKTVTTFPQTWANTCKVYVPAGTLEAYKASELWSRFAFLEEWEPDATGIETAKAVTGGINAGVYTVSGVKVANQLNGSGLPAGIYIVDGKKVCVGVRK